ncbi:MAG: AsmA family protein [Terracidiphilus sp.]|jgi:AsmA protein
MKRWVKFAIVVAVLIILILVVVPFFINADTFRPQIESQLSSSLNRQVTLGHLTLSLITGSLVAENISIADDPALSQTPFLEAKKLDLGIELGQFLFHHSVRITKLTVDSPSIHLIHLANGTWNFSSMGSSSAQPSSSSSNMAALSVDALNINDGSATVSSVPAAGNPFTCSAIKLSVKQFSFTNSFPFELSVKLPGDGSVKLSGTGGPIAQQDASKTPFQATLEIKHFDPVAANVIQPSDGISMVADMDAKVASDGTNLTSNGKIVASKLKLAANGSPAAQPVNLDYSIADNLGTRMGQVSDLAIHAGAAAVHITGSFHPAGNSVALNLHLSAPSLPVDQLEQLLPAAGITLPSGSQLKGGTLTANLTITGPANALTIAGPVAVDNTQLAGFDLGSKIQGINPLGGTSGGTQIAKLSTDVNSSPQGASFNNINASVPVIGTASGSGTISPAEALNFQLVAKFSNSSIVGSTVNTGMNAVAGFLGDRSNTAASKGIPMTVTGTASNPLIRANVGAMVKQSVGSVLGNSNGQQGNNPVKTLKGLFGH